MIGKPVVRSHVVELRRRLVVEGGPTFSAVGGNGRAAVVAVDQTLRVGGIDPQRMIIAVRRTDPAEGLAAIIGAIRSGVQNVDCVGRLWIGEDVGVIPGALAESVIISC